MPKTLTASKAALESLNFVLKGGQVVGLEAVVEVQYGSKRIAEAADLWPDLTVSQRTQLQLWTGPLREFRLYT